MEILEVYLMEGTMACIASNCSLKWVRIHGPPHIVRAAGTVVLCGGDVSRVAGVSCCISSTRAPPILTLFHRELEDFNFGFPRPLQRRFGFAAIPRCRGLFVKPVGKESQLVKKNQLGTSKIGIKLPSFYA